MTTLDPDQRDALDKIKTWAADPVARRRPFELTGFAGTGKTTLARMLPGVTGRTTLYGSFTGKAAQVLLSKGCQPASTLHSLVYTPVSGDDAERAEAARRLIADPHDTEARKIVAELARPLSFARKEDSILSLLGESGHGLLVVDEASMVGEKLAEDLLSFGVPIVALGDPAQLPPVAGTGALLSKTPDVLLTRVHRQAEGSDVLDLATAIRKTGDLPEGFRYNSKANGLRLADQIIVGTHGTRLELIERVRGSRGLIGLADWQDPITGDRIVVRSNNRELGVFNGQQFEVLDLEGRDGLDDTCDLIRMLVQDDQGNERWLSFWRHGFHRTGHKTDGTDDLKSLPYGDQRRAVIATFGQVITCHSAQGSEWDNVLVVDDWRKSYGDRDKWLYTAVTRAAKKVRIANRSRLLAATA